jgi:membrane protein
VRAAAIGGVFGGTMWSAAVYGYAAYAQYSQFYASVYGSLSAIPIFLFWLYVSWVIVLLGAQVAFASENLTTYREELLASNASQAARELLALRIVVEVAGRFLRGEPPVTREALPHALQASGRLVNMVVDVLLELGCLVQVGPAEQITLSRDPHGLTPMELMKMLRCRGEDEIWLSQDRVTQRLRGLSDSMTEAAGKAAHDVTIAELALEGAAKKKG